MSIWQGHAISMIIGTIALPCLQGAGCVFCQPEKSFCFQVINIDSLSAIDTRCLKLFVFLYSGKEIVGERRWKLQRQS